MKVLLKRLHLNGHTIGFHPQTQHLEPHTKQTVSCESTAEEVAFEWSHHGISSTDSKVRTTYKTNSTMCRESTAESYGRTIGFHPQTETLEQRTKQIVAYESTAEKVSFEWSHRSISSTDSKVRTTYKTNSAK